MKISSIGLWTIIVISILAFGSAAIFAPSTSDAQIISRSYDELQQNKRAQADVRALRQIGKMVNILQDISVTLNDIESNQRQMLRRMEDIKRKVR